MFFLLLCSFEINHVFGYFFDYFCCRFCCCRGNIWSAFCCLTCFTYAMNALVHPKTTLDHRLLAVSLPTSPPYSCHYFRKFPGHRAREIIRISPMYMLVCLFLLFLYTNTPICVHAHPCARVRDHRYIFIPLLPHAILLLHILHHFSS